jgi:hypothetical protein
MSATAAVVTDVAVRYKLNGEELERVGVTSGKKNWSSARGRTVHTILSGKTMRSPSECALRKGQVRFVS